MKLMLKVRFGLDPLTLNSFVYIVPIRSHSQILIILEHSLSFQIPIMSPRTPVLHFHFTIEKWPRAVQVPSLATLNLYSLYILLNPCTRTYSILQQLVSRDYIKIVHLKLT